MGNRCRRSRRATGAHRESRFPTGRSAGLRPREGRPGRRRALRVATDDGRARHHEQGRDPRTGGRRGDPRRQQGPRRRDQRRGHLPTARGRHQRDQHDVLQPPAHLRRRHRGGVRRCLPLRAVAVPCRGREPRVHVRKTRRDGDGAEQDDRSHRPLRGHRRIRRGQQADARRPHGHGPSARGRHGRLPHHQEARHGLPASPQRHGRRPRHRTDPHRRIGRRHDAPARHRGSCRHHRRRNCCRTAVLMGRTLVGSTAVGHPRGVGSHPRPSAMGPQASRRGREGATHPGRHQGRAQLRASTRRRLGRRGRHGHARPARPFHDRHGCGARHSGCARTAAGRRDRAGVRCDPAGLIRYRWRQALRR